MIAERNSFNKLSSKKASHYEWIKHYTDPTRLHSNDELDHVAFLSLWFSRFVFPAHPGKTVSENMFPIAIRLSMGAKIALGPSVLASIYRDMRVLKDHVLRTEGGEMSTSLTVWAPFQLVHVWALEHFVALRKEKPHHSLGAGEPRVSRWTGFDVKMDLMYAVSVLESPDEFQWRPYMPHLGDWRPPCFYKDIGNWICLSQEDIDIDDMGRSYVLIPTPCELVCVDCIEWQRECWSDHNHPKEKLMEQLHGHFQQVKKPTQPLPLPSPPTPKGKATTTSGNLSLSYHLEKQHHVNDNNSRKRGMSRNTMTNNIKKLQVTSTRQLLLPLQVSVC